MDVAFRHRPDRGRRHRPFSGLVDLQHKCLRSPRLARAESRKRRGLSHKSRSRPRRLRRFAHREKACTAMHRRATPSVTASDGPDPSSARLPVSTSARSSANRSAGRRHEARTRLVGIGARADRAQRLPRCNRAYESTLDPLFVSFSAKATVDHHAASLQRAVAAAERGDERMTGREQVAFDLFGGSFCPERLPRRGFFCWSWPLRP